MEGGGVTFLQEKTVEWLNTMRLGDGGFISTVDTVVALQALVLYSYHSRIKVKKTFNLVLHDLVHVVYPTNRRVDFVDG